MNITCLGIVVSFKFFKETILLKDIKTQIFQFFEEDIVANLHMSHVSIFELHRRNMHFRQDFTIVESNCKVRFQLPMLYEIYNVFNYIWIKFPLYNLNDYIECNLIDGNNGTEFVKLSKE